MIFYFGTSKVNQTKYRASAYWHVYSNINNPASCTVIALVKYLFYNLDILNTNSLLFPGNYQYKILCDVLHQGKGEYFIFAHAFLTMEWSFMARSKNGVNMHIKYIQWGSDCLIFYFGKPKVNQTGERASDSWYVYSNPKNPNHFPCSCPG